MSKSIYAIENEYMLLAEQLIENGGELSLEEQNLLNINKEELNHKAQNYGLLIKTLEGENAFIDTEIERLSKLANQRSKLVTRLKAAISDAMQLYEVSEIKTPLIKFSFRRSEAVEIVNMAQLDAKYIKETVSLEPDKNAIKLDLKSGIEVTGAVIKNNLSLQIK